MEIPTLKGEPRKVAGSRAAARLRRAGKLPAIVYGHRQEALPVSLDYHDVELHLRHGTHVVNLDIDGQNQSCLFKDAQYDHLGAHILHVDLTRVDLSERVKVHVDIELRGTAKGVAEGGALQPALAELEIECPVNNIPDVIRVDVSHLELDQVLHVKDLTLDPGLTAMTDPETVIAVVRMPVVKAELAEAVAESATPTSTEPEVIAKGKEEKEEEPEKK